MTVLQENNEHFTINIKPVNERCLLRPATKFFNCLTCDPLEEVALYFKFLNDKDRLGS